MDDLFDVRCGTSARLTAAIGSVGPTVYVGECDNDQGIAPGDVRAIAIAQEAPARGATETAAAIIAPEQTRAAAATSMGYPLSTVQGFSGLLLRSPVSQSGSPLLGSRATTHMHAMV